ncbi:retrotransposon protein, putative, ty1-copia subclass [Tanacetum coccineum]
MTKSPFTRTCERGEGLLNLVHTDVCGPFRSATKDGKRYYVTFTDDFSRYGYVYLIKHKLDTFEVFKRYQNEVENQLGRKIKLTPPRTPQLNGVAERRNRTLLNMVVTPIEPDDISLPIRITCSRVSKPSQDLQFYYGSVASPEAAKWKEAMKSEIDLVMHDNQVWNLDDTTLILKLVGLAKIKSIRIMLTIAAFHDYEIWQMDVNTTFLNRKLTKDVFMAQPEVSKQDTVADSTCESEYIAACEASKEAIWMKNFIGDLGVVPTVQDPIEIFCDNESAVALTKEPKDHESQAIERKIPFCSKQSRRRTRDCEGHTIRG